MTTSSTEHGPFKTLAALRKANRAAGRYWFSRDTMRYWACLAYPPVYGGFRFVSSQRTDCYDATRRYRVNRVDRLGCIIPEEHRVYFSTLTEARAAAREAAAA